MKKPGTATPVLIISIVLARLNNLNSRWGHDRCREPISPAAHGLDKVVADLAPQPRHDDFE